MGQHKRTVTCTECPATAPLSTAKASWKGCTGAGHGLSFGYATWRCPTCEAKRHVPKVSFLQQLARNVRARPAISTRLPDLPPRPAPRVTDDGILAQLSAKAVRPTIGAMAARGRLGPIVALIALSALVPESERPVPTTEPDPKET